jgi:N-acylglucosamine 2-epimerase
MYVASICRELKDQFTEELLTSIVPFWERFSPDKEYGGYFSCLDRNGEVFDTDKFLWMQGREIWCFSYLYNHIAPKAEWLELARLGAGFLKEHAFASNGDCWFSLDREGEPLVAPYNIFSDCFCAAGFAEYARASNEEWARKEAIRLWYRIQERKEKPKGIWTKQISENRPIRTMAMPMIQLWLSDVFEGLLPIHVIDKIVSESVEQVLGLHADRKRMLLFERVFPDGSHPQGMDGRLLSPGHALETLWLAAYALQKKNASENDGNLLYKNLDTISAIAKNTLEIGWDNEYGGLYYYRDADNKPLEKLESDMKLWWVHAEAMCATLLLYRLTFDDAFWQWFLRLKEWTWAHFRDPAFGEWFGYLDRHGSIANSLKGGKWKGMFHIPRALMVCTDILDEILKTNMAIESKADEMH